MRGKIRIWKRLAACAAAALTACICCLTGLAPMPVSAENAYQSWKQGDPRWGSMVLGQSGQTMAEIGCALTSLAILSVHCGAADESNFDPGVLCSYYNQNGGFASDGSLYWETATTLLPDLSFCGFYVLSGTTEAAVASEIEGLLAEGYFLICAVKNQGHFVTIRSVTDNTVTMFDPASGTGTSLFDAYAVSGIRQLRLFRSTAQPREPLPQNESRPGIYTVNVQTTLNVREGPGTTYQTVGTLDAGAVVTVLRVENGWGMISLADDSVGWVRMYYLQYQASLESDQSGIYLANVETVLNVRSGPDTEFSVLTTLPPGSIVQIYEAADGWGLMLQDGQAGWVSMAYLLPVETANPLCGDLDGDGVLTEEDIAALGVLLSDGGMTSEQSYAADVNLDDCVDSLDLLMLRLWLSSIGA